MALSSYSRSDPRSYGSPEGDLGIYDWLREKIAGLGKLRPVSGMGPRSPLSIAAPVSPGTLAADTPPGADVNVGGATKTEGMTPPQPPQDFSDFRVGVPGYNPPVGGGGVRAGGGDPFADQGLDFSRTSPLPADPYARPTPRPQPSSPLMVRLPEENWKAYDPEAGIEFFAGPREGPVTATAPESGTGTGVRQSFMGMEGTPGGGAFSPSQQDWSKVANPEGFPSYWEEKENRIRRADMAATEAKLNALAQDPMYEERQRADIWRGAQVGVQTGIQDALRQQFEREMAAVEAHLKDQTPPLSPEAFQKEMQSAAYEINQRIYGDRGMTGGLRSYGNPDLNG